MTVRQRIDELISDSIDEIKGRQPAVGPPEVQTPEANVTVEIDDLTAQVRELTTQMAGLLAIIRSLRKE
jgi:hypothetical protein